MIGWIICIGLLVLTLIGGWLNRDHPDNGNKFDIFRKD